MPGRSRQDIAEHVRNIDKNFSRMRRSIPDGSSLHSLYTCWARLASAYRKKQGRSNQRSPAGEPLLDSDKYAGKQSAC
jgi:hypothetical protein